MWDALDITEEEAQGLAEIARHDLELARDFARRALEATDNAEANRLARSYQRAARSYRQTLAVKARLKRDLTAAARVQADIPKARPGGAAVARRIGELRTALLRLSWDEADPPGADFGEAPLDDDVARIALDLGLSPEAIARWREVPDPPQAALDCRAEELAWQSSA
jgi:hypothetical protein